MKTITSFILIACSLSVFSQNLRTITTYHDFLQKKKHEVFTAEPNSLSKQGNYKQYDELGTLIEDAFYRENNLQGIHKIYYDASLANSHSKPTDYYGKLFAANNYVDGVLEGVSKQYQYLNGQQALLKDFIYKNGKEIKSIEYYMETNVIASSENDNGECYTNFENGAKESIYKRTNGNINGKYIKYYNNGKVASEGDYTHGIKTGVWKNYSENGILKLEETNFKIGDCPVILMKEFSDQGVPVKEIKLIESNQIQEIIYYENGNKKNEALYSISSDCEKLKNGNEKTFYESGDLECDFFNKDGEKDGNFKKYYENGKLLSEGVSSNGMEKGIFKSYYENGVIQSVTDYGNGGSIAYVKNYYDNSNLEFEGKVQIIGETQIGDWKYYKEDGTLDYTLSEQGLKTTSSELESKEYWNKILSNKNDSWKLYDNLTNKCGAYCAGSSCTVEKKKVIFTAGREIFESITKQLDSRTSQMTTKESYKLSEQMRKSLEKCNALVDIDSKAIEKLLQKAATIDEKITILTN